LIELFWRLATLVPLKLPRWLHNILLYTIIFGYAVGYWWVTNYHISISLGPWWWLSNFVLIVFMLAFFECSLLEIFFFLCLGLISALLIVLIAVLGNAFAPFLLNMPGALISLILIMSPWFIAVYLSVADSRFDGAQKRYHAAQLKYHPAMAKRGFSGISYPEDQESPTVDEKDGKKVKKPKNS